MLNSQPQAEQPTSLFHIAHKEDMTEEQALTCLNCLKKLRSVLDEIEPKTEN